MGLLEKLEYSSGISGDVGQQEEIIEILNAVKDYYWNFSYLRMSGKRVVSHGIELTDVSERQGIFSVMGLNSGRETCDQEEFYFRANSGGMSIAFKASLATGNFEVVGTQFKLPDSAHFTQARNAIRVNVIDVEEIPAVFHGIALKPFTGKVVDLSESGAKIQFEGNVAEHINSEEFIDDCEMRLSEDSAIASRVKVLGCVYDSDSNTSFLRCQFLQLQDNSELQLHQLIYRALKRQGKVDLALAG